MNSFFKDPITARVDRVASQKRDAHSTESHLFVNLNFKFYFDFQSLIVFALQLVSISGAHSTVFSFSVNTLFSFNFLFFRATQLNVLTEHSCAFLVRRRAL
jgi:hypothetical protein